MRSRRAFIGLLFAAFVLVSLLADRGEEELGAVTGIVTDWQAGTSISVANEATDPDGIPMVLRRTVYEGDGGAIRRGVRVRVWFRSVGERRFVADNVRVLGDGGVY